jgi:hypothetical protein
MIFIIVADSGVLHAETVLKLVSIAPIRLNSRMMPGFIYATVIYEWQICNRVGLERVRGEYNAENSKNSMRLGTNFYSENLILPICQTIVQTSPVMNAFLCIISCEFRASAGAQETL